MMMLHFCVLKIPVHPLIEMAHVIAWARENKMSVNLLKTVELVSRRPNISNDLLPSVMTNVRGVEAAKLLAVHLTQNLTYAQHMRLWRYVTKDFAHDDALDYKFTFYLLYLLAQLKRQWLDLSALDSVFNAIIANKIIYSIFGNNFWR